MRLLYLRLAVVVGTLHMMCVMIKIMGGFVVVSNTIIVNGFVNI